MVVFPQIKNFSHRKYFSLEVQKVSPFLCMIEESVDWCCCCVWQVIWNHLIVAFVLMNVCAWTAKLTFVPKRNSTFKRRSRTDLIGCRLLNNLLFLKVSILCKSFRFTNNVIIARCVNGWSKLHTIWHDDFSQKGSMLNCTNKGHYTQTWYDSKGVLKKIFKFHNSY